MPTNTIYKSKLSGNISIIASKSLSHRYMIAASFTNGVSYINNVLDSQDLTATINILKNLGVTISNEGNDYIVTGSKLKYNKTILDANESGSTLRFFIPILWTLNEEVIITGKKSLGIRPLSVYEQLAEKNHLVLQKTNNNFPIKLSGQLLANNYEIDGNVSSQFISGLIFGLSLLENDSSIKITSKHIASKDYIDLTVDTLNNFGVKVDFNNNTYYIKGSSEYKPLTKRIEGDFSQAAFFIVAAIITNSKLTISNLNFNSVQGDIKIIEIIKNMNVKYEIKDDSITILNNNTLKPTPIDLFNIPDLGPILMVLASFIDETTIFYNIDRLYTKESNRLEAMKLNLEIQGIKFNIKDNTLYLTGVKEFKGNQVFDTFNDHRIAMALAVYGLNCKEEIKLNDYSVVNKSYPTFFEELIKIGGIVKND